jgi:hypothetical protein
MNEPKDAASPPPRTPLQIQAIRLFDERQYKSCELVALCELSELKMTSDDDGHSHNAAAITLEILGDCAVFTDRHRQANNYFRDA